MCNCVCECACPPHLQWRQHEHEAGSRGWDQVGGWLELERVQRTLRSTNDNGRCQAAQQLQVLQGLHYSECACVGVSLCLYPCLCVCVRMRTHTRALTSNATSCRIRSTSSAASRSADVACIYSSQTLKAR